MRGFRWARKLGWTSFFFHPHPLTRSLANADAGEYQRRGTYAVKEGNRHGERERELIFKYFSCRSSFTLVSPSFTILPFPCTSVRLITDPQWQVPSFTPGDFFLSGNEPITSLGSARGFFLDDLNVPLLLQRGYQFAKSPRVELHAFQKLTVTQFAPWCLSKLAS